MQLYTVIWRDDGDDYMFTEVQTVSDPQELTPLAWVLEAADIEYAEWDAAEQIQAKAELLEGFELLDVVKGKLESVL